MPITNLSNTHLTAAQVADAQAALAQLETALAAITVNLTAEDRQKYGSINEQNKLLVNKVNDYHKNQPLLSTPQIDWTEFDNDYNSRQNIEALMARMESLITRLSNAKILHDYDNYQAALTDYAFTSYMAGTAAPGFETKMNDLKQFFGRTAQTKPAPTPPVE